jgi:hypothetical protein
MNFSFMLWLVGPGGGNQIGRAWIELSLDLVGFRLIGLDQINLDVDFI